MSLSILQLANKGINPPDGGTMGITLFTRELARLGHQVTLFALTTEKHNNPYIFPEALAENIRLLSVPVKTKPSIWNLLMHFFGSRDRAYMAKRFYHLTVQQKLIEHLKANKYDIIQLEGPYMGLYLPTIQKYSNAAIVLRAHNLEYRIWERKAHLAKGVNRMLFTILSKEIFRFEKQLFQTIQAILPITHVDGQQIAKLAPHTPQHVIPFCLEETEKKAKNSTKEKDCIGYIGALDWQPNIEGLYWFMEKIWPNVKSEYPRAKMQVAGRNAPNKLIRDLSKNGIEFIGEVADANKFITQHSLMVVPLWSGSGIRVKIIEGMALAMPMVVTSMALEGIEATDGEQLCVAYDEKAFTDQIIYLLKHPDVAKTLGQAAQQYALKNFSVNNWFPALTQFYQKIARNV